MLVIEQGRVIIGLQEMISGLREELQSHVTSSTDISTALRTETAQMIQCIVTLQQTISGHP